MPDSYSIDTRHRLEALEQRVDAALAQFLALQIRVAGLEQGAGSLAPPPDTMLVTGPTAGLEPATPARRRARPGATAAETTDKGTAGPGSPQHALELEVQV